MPRLNPKSSAPSESSTHPDCGDGFTADCAHIVSNLVEKPMRNGSVSKSALECTEHWASH